MAPGDGTSAWRVEHVGETDSTNRLVLERARAGEPAGLVVVADHQTAGRGRLDRTWEAPPGSSLLVSVLLRPEPTGRDGHAHAVVSAAGVALAEAVETVAGVDAGVKWPNDVVVGERKLAGILAEAEGDALVVGIGCNVNWDAFPDELADRATACNLEAGRVVDRDALLDELLERLSVRLADPRSTARASTERLVTIGRRVRVAQVDGELVGDAIALDPDGALVVRDDAGVEHHVVAGDVVHLRDA